METSIDYNNGNLRYFQESGGGAKSVTLFRRGSAECCGPMIFPFCSPQSL